MMRMVIETYHRLTGMFLLHSWRGGWRRTWGRRGLWCGAWGRRRGDAGAQAGYAGDRDWRAGDTSGTAERLATTVALEEMRDFRLDVRNFLMLIPAWTASTI